MLPLLFRVLNEELSAFECLRIDRIFGIMAVARCLLHRIGTVSREICCFLKPSNVFAKISSLDWKFEEQAGLSEPTTTQP
jgi:hypothetical protein